jgi:hypothetical protein
MRQPGRSRDERTFLLWIIASVVLYMFISATQPQLAYAYGTLPLFVMFGMGLALVKSPLTPDTAGANEGAVRAGRCSTNRRSQRQTAPIKQCNVEHISAVSAG